MSTSPESPEAWRGWPALARGCLDAHDAQGAECARTPRPVALEPGGRSVPSTVERRGAIGGIDGDGPVAASVERRRTSVCGVDRDRSVEARVERRSAVCSVDRHGPVAPSVCPAFRDERAPARGAVGAPHPSDQHRRPAELHRGAGGPGREAGTFSSFQPPAERTGGLGWADVPGAGHTDEQHGRRLYRAGLAAMLSGPQTS